MTNEMLAASGGIQYKGNGSNNPNQAKGNMFFDEEEDDGLPNVANVWE